MRQRDVDAESLLKFETIDYNTSQTQLDEEYVRIYKFLEILNLYRRQFDHQ